MSFQSRRETSRSEFSKFYIAHSPNNQLLACINDDLSIKCCLVDETLTEDFTTLSHQLSCAVLNQSSTSDLLIRCTTICLKNSEQRLLEIQNMLIMTCRLVYSNLQRIEYTNYMIQGMRRLQLDIYNFVAPESVQCRLLTFIVEMDLMINGLMRSMKKPVGSHTPDPSESMPLKFVGRLCTFHQTFVQLIYTELNMRYLSRERDVQQVALSMLVHSHTRAKIIQSVVLLLKMAQNADYICVDGSLKGTSLRVAPLLSMYKSLNAILLKASTTHSENWNDLEVLAFCTLKLTPLASIRSTASQASLVESLMKQMHPVVDSHVLGSAIQLHPYKTAPSTAVQGIMGGPGITALFGIK